MQQAIDKLDKENFGLKLKIHYLQEQLEKAGPGYNQAALKENTELKVTKVTMQRDIARYKKSLHQAERDLEAYRLQLQELREKAKRRQVEEAVQREMEWMREEIETRETQVRELREELKNAKERESEEVEKLRNEVEDLEAAAREKDRIIEEKEDEIDNLKAHDGKENDAADELEAELERAKEQLEELQESLDQAKAEAREANEAQQQAIEEKEQAEENLKELQDEMANKSFSTKGLSRQLEEKAAKLEEQVNELRQENSNLNEGLQAKTRRETELHDQLREAQRQNAAEEERLRNEIENANQQRDFSQTERDEALNRLKQVLDELDRKADEKELLQTRHDALTEESAGLQRELAKAHSSIRELEQAIEDEKQRALDNNHALRTQHREEIDRLQEEIEALQHEIEDKEGQFALEQDRWESTRRTLQSQKERAEEQAAGFKRTIEKLQDVELTLTGRHGRLQEVIDSEKDRHLQEEAVLGRQVKELNEDIASKRQIVEEQRNELLSVKEELRVSRREEQLLKEKVQALEDEVVILQASLEEEKEYAKGQLKKGASDLEIQLQKAMNDRQNLRDQLANTNVELHNLRTSVAETEIERDELRSQLERMQSQTDGSNRLDQEKIELRKSKLRLENELQRLKEERTSLVEARYSLENELNAEIERATQEENRLTNEITQLQDKLHAASAGRDRELTMAKSKVQRLEKRVSELETLVDQQQPADIETSTAAADLSMLRHNLDEARRREKTLLQREADHKASARAFKTRIADLERSLHEVQIKKFETHSTRSSPSDKFQEELRSLRKKLAEAHKSLSDLKAKNRELERNAIREEDRKDLHELLKSSTLEAESLALKLSERDARVSELKSQLRRIREERASALKKADMASQELEVLQDRYDQAMDEMTTKTDRKGRHDKEMRGLGKEIIWLRARLKREEKFRRDLAWSKGLMELGERVRVAWYVSFFSPFCFLHIRTCHLSLPLLTFTLFLLQQRGRSSNDRSNGRQSARVKETARRTPEAKDSRSGGHSDGAHAEEEPGMEQSSEIGRRTSTRQERGPIAKERKKGRLDWSWSKMSIALTDSFCWLSWCDIPDFRLVLYLFFCRTFWISHAKRSLAGRSIGLFVLPETIPRDV
jgi:chromosome segregation ATPase